MIYNRVSGHRMVSHRRMFSRRTVAHFVTGIILGFNIASWFAIPPPSHTDIEIEVIAGGAGKLRGNDLPDFRLGAARVRRNKIENPIKTGRDCDHEVIEYRDIENEKLKKQEVRKIAKFDLHSDEKEQEPVNERKEESKYGENEDAIDEFNIDEERLKRQKELEVFYESDIETEDDGEIPQDSERLEDFQFPAHAQKYVDYDSELPNVQSSRNKFYGQKEVRKSSFQNSQASNSLNSKKVSDRKHFMYIGVLTAQKYLATRGRAIMDTWASGVPGKIEFYVGESVKNVNDGKIPLPLVNLPSVRDDAYPPQKKSFLLLKQMYDTYLNSGYQWFMRADDDAYIKTEKLENFLRKLNSSQPIFLGQTGLGNAEERGRLSLPHGDNYCMGGPGMILSREVLRRVGPHIRECVKHLYSWHEDVELSRCVRRFAGVNCAWSYQMQELFYEHYSLRKGYIDPYVNPYNPKLYTALTLHPNKNPQYQVKLHTFMKTQKIKALMKKIKELSRDLLNADRFLGKASDMEDFMLGISPTLNRFVPRKREEVPSWNFMTERLWYSSSQSQPRRSISFDMQLTIRDIIMHVMRAMNANSKARGRIIEFNQVAYGYRRVNPLYGAEYVLDLLLYYKRFKGRKVNIQVRRHAYLQQTFGKTVMHEQNPIDVQVITSMLDNAKPGILSSFLISARKGSSNLMSAVGLAPKAQLNLHYVSDELNQAFPDMLSMSKLDNKNDVSRQIVRYDVDKYSSFSTDNTKTNVPIVHIIIPLKGRYETFQSFMTGLERVSLSRGDPISLLIILFTSDDPQVIQDSAKTFSLLNKYSKRYPFYDLRAIPITGSFSRGLGLQIGASHFSNESLMFFCDVDVVFDTTFTKKCRANSMLGKTVYYPILFSQFHPSYQSVWSSAQEFPDLGINVPGLRNMSVVKKLQSGKDNFEIGDSMGYWRSYGYGLLCTYKRDFAATGGFDISIQGWGMEDVDLVSKFSTGLRARKSTKTDESLTDLSERNRVAVFRTPDPSLVHVYHPSHCDINLMENQLRMCRASRASGITSVHNLAKSWKSVKRHAVFDPVSEILPMSLDEQKKKNDFKERKELFNSDKQDLNSKKHVQSHFKGHNNKYKIDER